MVAATIRLIHFSENQEGCTATMSMTDEARQFWSAVYFLRQAHGRDHAQAVRVLRHLTRSSNGTIAGRAAQALMEHESAQPAA